jgi:hypothetical protein
MSIKKDMKELAGRAALFPVASAMLSHPVGSIVFGLISLRRESIVVFN